jgi:hypothetical protein
MGVHSMRRYFQQKMLPSRISLTICSKMNRLIIGGDDCGKEIERNPTEIES